MATSASSVGPPSLFPQTLPPHPVFVNSLPSKYLCTYCKQTLTHPVRQSECGHRFCCVCIEKLLNEEVTSCPAREDGCLRLTRQNIYPDRGTEREMIKLKVRCDNYPTCQKQIEWRHLQKHREECEFNMVDCPNNGCGQKILQQDLEQHIGRECRFKPRECRFCHLKFASVDLEQHELICQETVDVCEFKDEGCKFEGKRKVMKQHKESQISYHLELVMNGSRKEKERTRTLEVQHKQLKAQCEAQEKKMQRLQSELDKFRESVKTSTQEMHKSMSKQMEEVRHLSETSKSMQGVHQQVQVLQTQVTNLELNCGNSTGAGALSDEERTRMRSQERTVATHAHALSEYEIRFRCLETTNHKGELIWKITGYRSRKEASVSGRTLSIYSQPFYTDAYGYKMCARLYLNGDGLGKQTHASLYFVVMKGEYDALLPWPFRQRVTMILMDQENGRNHIQDTFRPDITSSSFQRPVNQMNIASGSPMFVQQSVLESSKYLRNDTIFIKMKVDISDLNHFGI